MNQRHVVAKKTNTVQSTVCQKIPGHERQGGYNQDQIIRYRGKKTNIGGDNPPNEKEKDNGKEYERHPVDQPIRHRGPGPFKSGFFPKGDMTGKPDGYHDQTDVKDIGR